MMREFVYRANIDHYLELLNEPDLAAERRSTAIKLLIEEEDKLGQFQEQLEFAEKRAADGRQRLNGLRRKLDGTDASSAHRPAAERLLANFEAVQVLLDRFRDQIRAKANSSRL